MVLDLSGNVNNLPEMTEEEKERRTKEFAELNTEGNNILDDIAGDQNSRYSDIDKILVFIANSIANADDGEESYIDSEFSPEFLGFLSWYTNIRQDKEMKKKYISNIDKLNKIFNDGIENHYLDNVFTGIMNSEGGKNMTPDAIAEIDNNDIIFFRFDMMSKSESDLIHVFTDINNLNINTWEDFEKLL